MKNAKKVSYKEVLAQNNYDLMVSEGARFCDARDVKNLILNNYTPEEAILKVAEEMIHSDFEYNIGCKYMNGYLETVHYLQNFVKNEGLQILQKRLEEKGCLQSTFWDIVDGKQYPLKKSINLLIEAGYSHEETHEWKDTFTEESILYGEGLDVAPSYRCDNLTFIPKVGERVFLGLSKPHLFPSDVIVTRIA